MASGYNYTRTQAFVLRMYNNDASQNFSELEDRVNENYNELLNYNEGLNDELSSIADNLDTERDRIDSIIANDISNLNSRLSTIENTGTTELTGDGL